MLDFGSKIINDINLLLKMNIGKTKVKSLKEIVLDSFLDRKLTSEEIVIICKVLYFTNNNNFGYIIYGDELYKYDLNIWI